MTSNLTLLLYFLAAFTTGLIDALPTDDYTFIAWTRSFYKHHREGATFADARLTCESEGAVLFHPETKLEIDTVLDTLQFDQSTGWWFWTGISDLRKTNHFETVDGRPVSLVYHRWGEGYPAKGVSRGDHCGAISASDHLLYIEWGCSVSRQFICKRSYNNVDLMQAIEGVNTRTARAIKQLEDFVKQQVSEQTEVLKREISKQTVAFQQLEERAGQQARALERLAGGFQVQILPAPVNATGLADQLADPRENNSSQQ